MILGKLIKSNTHTDYVCQIYSTGEVEVPPSPIDYAFGTFVRMPVGANNSDLVGVVYDTILLNPDFGNLGPRLSPTVDLAIFSPDYLAEKATLVGITALGTIASNGSATHGVPPLAAQTDTLVERMDEDEVRAFHQPPSGRVQMGYIPLLLAVGTPLVRHLLLHLVTHVQGLFPEYSTHLNVLRGELSWQAYVNPLGGG